MRDISRHQVTTPTNLLVRILERPGLVAAVRELPGPVLGKLIDRIGLEDAGELVALATTAQLERLIDEDVWRADGAGEDETFRPERFALWLRVMLETGEASLVQRLCELPQDLLALAVHRLVLVLDMDVLTERLSDAGEEGEQIARALETSVSEEWEEFRLIARDADAWDDVWEALLSLDREHHDRLRAILEQCCAMSTEYISGQGGLFQVLTAEQMVESDAAAARDDRRSAEGFISPADARAFLQLASRRDSAPVRDPITHAYFRGLDVATKPKANRRSAHSFGEATSAGDLDALVMLLREADVIATTQPQPQPLLALSGGSPEERPRLIAPLFEQAMSELRQRDPERFSTRAREVGYLVNVWIAGGSHEGRRPRPMEALETVLTTCEAGLRTTVQGSQVSPRQALVALEETPADILFRLGSGDHGAKGSGASGAAHTRRG